MMNEVWMELGEMYLEVMEELDRFSEQEPVFSDINIFEEEDLPF